jgi:Domain of unknown function (DUF4177)
MIRSRLLLVLGIVVLLCVVGLSGRANMVAPAPAIKWEYKAVYVPGGKQKDVEDTLNKAGADGWELAMINGYLIFKRPKQ